MWGALLAEIHEETAAVWQFLIDREIEAPERYSAIQSYRAAMAILRQQVHYVEVSDTHSTGSALCACALRRHGRTASSPDDISTSHVMLHIEKQQCICRHGPVSAVNAVSVPCWQSLTCTLPARTTPTGAV